MIVLSPLASQLKLFVSIWVRWHWTILDCQALCFFPTTSNPIMFTRIEPMSSFSASNCSYHETVAPKLVEANCIFGQRYKNYREKLGSFDRIPLKLQKQIALWLWLDSYKSIFSLFACSTGLQSKNFILMLGSNRVRLIENRERERTFLYFAQLHSRRGEKKKEGKK